VPLVGELTVGETPKDEIGNVIAMQVENFFE
jgi:hypothetical protein